MTRPPEWFKRWAVPLADKIVYASNAYVSVKSTLNDLSSSLVTFTGSPMGEADVRLRDAVRLIRPWTSPSLDLVRVGAPHDGGYVMAAPIRAVGALAIGVGADVSWDQDVAARGIPVAMFDHTVRRPPTAVPGATFHRLGVGRGRHLRSLEELARVAGFGAEGDLLLKMDVEGAEWNAIDERARDVITRCSQIVLELHGLEGLGSASAAAPILRVLSLLGETHMTIHVHANNYDRLVQFDRWWFPNSIEVSLLRRDMLPEAQPADRLRTDLDAPCDPRVAEIDLAGITTIA